MVLWGQYVGKYTCLVILTSKRPSIPIVEGSAPSRVMSRPTMANTLSEDDHLPDSVLSVSEYASTSLNSTTFVATLVVAIEQRIPFHSDVTTLGRCHGWQ
jgi:hypothetical protein